MANVDDPHLERIRAARRQFEAVRDRVPVRGHVGGSSFVPHAPALPPDAIPGYELKREVHRGGQGVVYEAVQQSTNRTVAVKVLHGGRFSDPRSQPRFEREVQILGQLHHPNVVTVHDSGMANGCAFFVMDYIRGVPLDAWVQHQDRDIRATLELFARVCDAVNAAHLRGVIHRDLKPANILIDPSGEPRIVDFGLAKVSEFDTLAGAGSSVVTLTGQFVGSLPWASPEQASGDQSAVDTRTDVYALGVILYHALTGQFPYRVAGSLRDVLDAIVTSEPAPPGTVRRQINDEIETIILKCLSKAPERRYQSAGELARDFRHYLSGEPIDAKRDSTWYVLRKTLRRHRVPTAVAAAFILLVTASSVALSLLYSRANTEAGRADAEAAAARTAQKKAEAALIAESEQRILAKLHAEQAETAVTAEQKLSTFLLDVLSSSRPTASGETVTVGDALREAASRIDDEFADEPKHLTKLHYHVGKALRDLGHYAEAEAHLEAAFEECTRDLGADHGLTLKTGTELAGLQIQLGRLQDALPALLMLRSQYEQRFGMDSEQALGAISRLGLVYHELGRFEEAEPLLADVVRAARERWGSEALGTLTSMNNLARTQGELGRFDEAESLFRTTLASQRARFGREHPHTIATINNLASLYLQQSRLNEALPLFEESLELRRDSVGDTHPLTLQAMNNLGVVYERMGRFADAERLHRQAYDQQRVALGEHHPLTLHGMCGLAAALMGTGDLEEAVQIFDDATRAIHQALPPKHPLRATCVGNYGRCLMQLGRHEEAERILLSAYDAAVEIFPPDDARIRNIRTMIVDLYDDWGKPNLANQWRDTSATNVE